jgi:hypothetical protein
MELFNIIINDKIFLTTKSCGGHQAKRGKQGKNLSPRNRKACHSVSTALLKSMLVFIRGSSIRKYGYR